MFYDANGNLTQICDERTNSTTQVYSLQTYDALNRPTITTQPAVSGGTPSITSTYDGQDQLTGVLDPRGNTTAYTVDGLGKIALVASPDTGNTQNTFDSFGNLKTSTDARGAVSTFSYDVLNRVTSIAYANGSLSSPTTTFSYDGDGGTVQPYDLGHLTSIADESGTTRLSYNGFGDVINKVQVTPTNISQTLSYVYGTTGGVAGKLVQLTYPSGASLAYGYDSAGRVSTISATHVVSGATVTDQVVTNIIYDPFGMPKAWTWGNGTTYQRNIDLNGRVASFPLGAPASANALVRTLNYDPASNILSMTHTDMSGNAQPASNATIAPDSLSRITSYTQGSISQSYAYDLVGNRTSLNSYSNTIAATSNQLTATSGPAPAKNNVYAAGYLTSDGSNSYVYSARGRMQSANGTSYLYNGLGQRVYKSNSSATNRYVYDEGGHLLGEYDVNGHAISETVYLGDMPIALLRSN
jgi:YD repeat-containing protein